MLSTVAGGGQLDPPVGVPVSPTGPIAIYPQNFVFPRTISQPGTYVLMGDFVIDDGMPQTNTGFVIDADDVTIDLNGFEIRGDGMGPSGGDRAFFPGNAEVRNFVAKNGRIRDINRVSVDNGVTDVFIASRFEDLIIDNVNGVVVPPEGTMERCVIRGSSGDGAVIVGADGIVRDCVIDGFEGYAIQVRTRAIVEDNIISNGLTPDSVAVVSTLVAPGTVGVHRIRRNLIHNVFTPFDIDLGVPGSFVHNNIVTRYVNNSDLSGSDAPVAPNSASAGPFHNVFVP
ncbi:MAG: hypothetical protein Tsb0013_15710 [Phycisphaerales bacterium]